MMASIRELYGKFFAQMTQMSTAAAKIDETNVYQKANPNTKKIMYKLIADNTLPGSHIGGKENFKAFLEAVKSGKHGLILMEHYSNTDLPALTWLLENDMGAEGKDLADRIVAIAGMKLNEADANVRAFAESFTRWTRQKQPLSLQKKLPQKKKRPAQSILPQCAQWINVNVTEK